MSAYNAESALARLLRPHYARGDDEARALLREALTLTGDLQITGDTLHVRRDPASAPRRSNALAALCVELTDTGTRYPGTDLTLAYSIKGHPGSKRKTSPCREFWTPLLPAIMRTVGANSATTSALTPTIVKSD